MSSSLISIPNQRKVVSRLYSGVDGFGGSETDSKRLLANPATVYGELTPVGVQRLLKFLQLTDRDVFYDLGSGVGKVVLQAAMLVPVRKCVGIEVVESRCRTARRVLRTARSQGLIQSRRTSFRNESFLESNIRDATVIYAASTCFSSHLMRLLARKINGLKRKLTLITFRDFDRKHRGFQFVSTLKLDATWSANEEACVYRTTP